MKKLLDLMKNDWAGLTDKDEINTLVVYVEQGCLLGFVYGGEYSTRTDYCECLFLLDSSLILH